MHAWFTPSLKEKCFKPARRCSKSLKNKIKKNCKTSMLIHILATYIWLYKYYSCTNNNSTYHVYESIVGDTVHECRNHFQFPWKLEAKIWNRLIFDNPIYPSLQYHSYSLRPFIPLSSHLKKEVMINNKINICAMAVFWQKT